jgi:hypothetical protein
LLKSVNHIRMKRLLHVLSLVVFFAIPSLAQKEIRNPDGSYYKQCKHFAISKPLSVLAKEHPVIPGKGIKQQEAHDKARKHPAGKQLSGVPSTEDPIVQRQNGDRSIANTIENFDGQTSADGFFPLDPTGAVGPNHFVQSVNSNYQVFDKTGAALTPVIDLANLFTGSSDQGDPIVMYDKFADRWIVTEFETDNPPNGAANQLLFAVSTSPDPTGTYYLYTFEPDAADFADYPKYSIWSDGYYETCNCDNQKVTVYDRAKMLNGDQTAGFIVIPFISTPNNGFWCPQTLSADGALPPYGSPQYLFYFTDDNWGLGFQDKIKVYKIITNWNNNSGTITLDNTLTPQSFNSYFTGGTFQDVSQPGTSNKLDALDGFFSYRIPYIRWDGYNSAVMCNTVNTGSGNTIVAGVRWYELRQDTTTHVWSIFQQGTYSPSDGVSRWNPSIAMDMNGSIGLAYSVSSAASVYPGIRYTGRTKCDANGIMSLSETTAMAGASAYPGNDNRWGDYSHTTIDPADGGLTFWHTNQYMDNSQSLKTRIFSFQVPPCISTGIGAGNANDVKISLSAYQSGNSLNVKTTGLTANEIVEVGLYNIEGRLISKQMINSFMGSAETSINIADIAKAVYYVRVGNNGFQRVIKVAVQ